MRQVTLWSTQIFIHSTISSKCTCKPRKEIEIDYKWRILLFKDHHDMFQQGFFQWLHGNVIECDKVVK